MKYGRMAYGKAKCELSYLTKNVSSRYAVVIQKTVMLHLKNVLPVKVVA